MSMKILKVSVIVATLLTPATAFAWPYPADGSCGTSANRLLLYCQRYPHEFFPESAWDGPEPMDCFPIADAYYTACLDW